MSHFSTAHDGISEKKGYLNDIFELNECYAPPTTNNTNTADADSGVYEEIRNEVNVAQNYTSLNTETASDDDYTKLNFQNPVIKNFKKLVNSRKKITICAFIVTSIVIILIIAVILIVLFTTSKFIYKDYFFKISF